MENYVELLSLIGSFINFMSSHMDNFRVEYTYLTCHFRKAIAFRAYAGNHGGYFHLSVNENEVLSLENQITHLFRLRLSVIPCR